MKNIPATLPSLQEPGTPRPAQSDGMLMAFLGQRRSLVSELEDLAERRASIVAELQRPADRATATRLREELNTVNRGINDANVALAAVNRAIAGSSGADQAPAIVAAPSRDVQVVPVFGDGGRGGDVVPAPLALGGGVLLLLLGVAIGSMLARRLRRQAAESVRSLRAEFTDRMEKLTLSLDSIAVEIERIGEGQRYVTKALGEKQPVALDAIPARAQGAAIETGKRDLR